MSTEFPSLIVHVFVKQPRLESKVATVSYHGWQHKKLPLRHSMDNEAWIFKTSGTTDPRQNGQTFYHNYAP